MKKILAKDTQNRKIIKKSELKNFILKQISTNINFPRTVRWNALNKLSQVNHKNSKTHITNRCVKTINKKTFHTFSKFSRTVFFKLAKSGLISGLRKAIW
jgi:ribosomal protein S14